MPEQTATRLAEGVIEGTASLDDFARAGKAMRGARAAQQGSAAELRQAWALAQRGLRACIEAVFGGVGVASLQTVADTIDPDSQSARIDAAEMKGWLDQLFLSWGEQVGRFRRRGGDAPSMQVAMAATAPYLQYTHFTAAASDQIMAKLGGKLQPQPADRESAGLGGDDGGAPAPAKKRRLGKRAGAKRRERRERQELQQEQPPEKQQKRDGQQGKAASGCELCWPARPELTNEQFKQAQELAAKAFPKHCRFWMLNERGCFKGKDCPLKHEKPGGFQQQVIAKVKLE
jgi:hypothetical protein